MPCRAYNHKIQIETSTICTQFLLQKLLSLVIYLYVRNTQPSLTCCKGHQRSFIFYCNNMKKRCNQNTRTFPCSPPACKFCIAKDISHFEIYLKDNTLIMLDCPQLCPSFSTVACCLETCTLYKFNMPGNKLNLQEYDTNDKNEVMCTM